MGFSGGSALKQSSCIASAPGDMGPIPGSGRSSGGGHSNPLQYSCLENLMVREAGRGHRCPWGHKGSDMTEVTEHACTHMQKLSMLNCDSP